MALGDGDFRAECGAVSVASIHGYFRLCHFITCIQFEVCLKLDKKRFGAFDSEGEFTLFKSNGF